jgi:hypothetical protein
MKKMILGSVFVVGVLMALSQTASAVPVQEVPDAGSSSVLLGLALGAVAIVSRRLKS